MPDKDFLYFHLRDLPYFRALLRSVEATFYQTLDRSAEPLRAERSGRSGSRRSLPAPTLDLGCGDGHFASLTFDRPIDIGLDPCHRLIHEAGRRDAYRLLVEADGGAMTFPDGYFASAFSNSVLEHIPHVEQVLAETARVLRPGAPFVFCVPNPRYLSELCLSRVFGRGYTAWFRRISRVEHADEPQVWQARLKGAGFRLLRWWHYFSPSAMRVFEWGHYFGLPSLVTKELAGKWILAPTKWNLWLTEKFVRRYAEAREEEQGTFTFYVARKR